MSAASGIFVVGGVDYTHDVLSLFRRRFHERVAKATAVLAAIGRQNREARPIEQGYVDARYEPESYHYWGNRLGYECWQDPQFVREYKRDCEYCRVHNRNPNPTVGWVPGFEAANAYRLRILRSETATETNSTRFKKVYPS